MELENKFYSYGSKFKGAIFMSNRVTKLECLRRKLFGLPSSKAHFMKQIKAGMLLFLFEHEERKLYGVFEATCDGTMNIIPNAFLSSGCSFPAQVLFRRVWMCKPLSEDEFSDAVKDNYYAPKKFNFGLSYDQVFKLVQLFSSKKINLMQYQRPGIRNEIIEEFEKCDGRKVRERGSSTSLVLADPSTGDNIDSERYHGSPGSDMNDPISFEKLARKQSSSINKEPQLYQMAPDATEACKPNYLHSELNPPQLMGSTFPSHRSTGMTSKHPEYGHHTLGLNYSVQNPIMHAKSCSNIQPHQFDSQSSTTGTSPAYPSSPDLVGYSNVCLPTVSPERHLNFQDYKYESHTEWYNHSDPLISFKHGMSQTNGANSFTSLHSSDSLGYPDASTHEFDSEGQPAVGVQVLPAYVPLPITGPGDKNVRSYSNSPSKDIIGSYLTEPVEDDPRAMPPYLTADCKECSHKAEFRFHSNAKQSKTCVFSRLSKVPDACCMPESRKSIQKHGARKMLARHAPDQVARILLQNREQLIEVKRIPNESSMCDGEKKLESTFSMEPSMEISTGNVESSNDLIHEDGVAENANAKESTGPMFRNFDCMNEIHRVSGEIETKAWVDIVLDDDHPEEHKRRKLTPCVIGKKCGIVEGSTQEILGIETLVEDNDKNIKNVEMSTPCNFDIDSRHSSAFESGLHGVASEYDKGSRNCQSGADNENSTVSDAILGDVGSDKSRESNKGVKNDHLDAENKYDSVSEAALIDPASGKRETSAESLVSLGKVSNRNLIWFLQKSFNAQVKESDADHESGKREDASHMAG